MITNNKLEKSFGPVGSLSGIIVFCLAAVSLYYSLFGLLGVVIGAFVGFTSSSTLIDFDKKRVKFSNNLFGIIKTGKWISIESDMKIGLNVSNQVWTSFSQGNRSLDIDEKKLRIILYNSNKQKIMPLKKLESIETAKEEINNLRIKLGLNTAN